MNEKINDMINKAGTDVSGKWMSLEQAKKLAEVMVEECLIAVDKTDKQHIYTTFDQNMVTATIEKSKKAINQHFGVDQ